MSSGCNEPKKEKEGETDIYFPVSSSRAQKAACFVRTCVDVAIKFTAKLITFKLKFSLSFPLLLVLASYMASITCLSLSGISHRQQQPAAPQSILLPPIEYKHEPAKGTTVDMMGKHSYRLLRIHSTIHTHYSCSLQSSHI